MNGRLVPVACSPRDSCDAEEPRPSTAAEIEKHRDTCRPCRSLSKHDQGNNVWRPPHAITTALRPIRRVPRFLSVAPMRACVRNQIPYHYCHTRRARMTRNSVCRRTRSPAGGGTTALSEAPAITIPNKRCSSSTVFVAESRQPINELVAKTCSANHHSRSAATFHFVAYSTNLRVVGQRALSVAEAQNQGAPCLPHVA